MKPNGSISDSPEIHAAANGDANESDEEDWSEECLVDVYVKRSDTKTSTKPILRAPQRFVVVEKPTTSPTVDCMFFLFFIFFLCYLLMFE